MHIDYEEVIYVHVNSTKYIFIKILVSTEKDKTTQYAFEKSTISSEIRDLQF